jgi:GTPase SAR1 family protein
MDTVGMLQYGGFSVSPKWDNIDAFILMFDLTDIKTLRYLLSYLALIDMSNIRDVPIIVCGNKCDLKITSKT